MTREEINKELNYGITNVLMDDEEWVSKIEVENLIEEILDDYEYLEQLGHRFDYYKKEVIQEELCALTEVELRDTIRDIYFEQSEIAKLIYDELTYWISHEQKNQSKL